MNVIAGTSATTSEGGPVRPRLIFALLQRDFGRLYGLLMVLAVLAAAGAAHEVYVRDGGATPLLGGMLRRFDNSLLLLSVLSLVFRRAAIIEADHTVGWLAPFFAAGGSRLSYGALSVAAFLASPFLWFALGAVAFAVSVMVFSGSAELVERLPRTLGVGLLVLGSFSALTVAAGIVIRRGVVVAFLVATAALGPPLLAGRYAYAEALPPRWLILLQVAGPLPYAPPDLANTIRGVVYIVVVGAIAALVSHRYAGRVS